MALEIHALHTICQLKYVDVLLCARRAQASVNCWCNVGELLFV
jgi:hypothetical protein